MFDRLQDVERRYRELALELNEAAQRDSPELYQKTARARAELTIIVETYRQYQSVGHHLAETETILREESDAGIRQLAQLEVEELQSQKEALEEKLRVLLLPNDPSDKKNVILEIRAGTGGAEATLFAQEIFRMYARFAEKKGWKTEVLSVSYTGIGGVKEITATIEGHNVYSHLKYESGVHRVQRVPETEAQGRLHTSAITVAVLPEADEVEVQIDPKDLRIDTYCSSGPGGQSVNTTYSAVRITHLPTREVVTCQDEKSQTKNKSQALKVLRSRLLQRATQEQREKRAQNRKSMVGSGDRSEKIRTYNFPQNRVTDHRVGLSLHKLEAILGGQLDTLITRLATHDQASALAQEDPKVA